MLSNGKSQVSNSFKPQIFPSPGESHLTQVYLPYSMKVKASK